MGSIEQDDIQPNVQQKKGSSSDGYHVNTAFDQSLPCNDVIDLNDNNNDKGHASPSAYEFINHGAFTFQDQEKNSQKTKTEVKAVSISSLFRFAKKLDYLLIVIAIAMSLAHGVGMPLLLVIFGDMTEKFVKNSGNKTEDIYDADGVMTEPTKSILLNEVRLSCAAFAGVGGAVLIVAYGQVAFWLITANRQTFKIRGALFRAVLRQEIGWFDVNDSRGISTRLSDDINKIQEGIGDKIGGFFQWISTFISGINISFAKGWKLSLVCLSFSPVIAVCGAAMMKLTATSTTLELAAYAKAGAVATEVFSCVKTVTVFGGQEKECERYGRNLTDAKKKGIIKAMITGAGIGITYFVLFSSYCLAFWYGGKLIQERDYEVGQMLIVFFCVLFSSMALGNAAPYLQSFGQARGAAYYVWEIIDRKPEIDSSSNNGICPQSMTGNVDFVNIKFRYPSRPDIPILNGLTLTVKNGQTVALVGSSGCGKSTVVQLLQRFYDPMEGSVLVDGVDIKQLNIRWLRQRIGVVSQEPVLFAMTIAENIRYGRDDVSQEEIEQAARQANAHDFISQLPEKYNTLVGERGAQLSGGQKQRIAIARALVRDPRILLLDEATSALDTESEAVVQAALDKARLGRTTIVVAHRLSTIRTADVIYGLKDGVVQEYGTHEQLMKEEGIYYKLVKSQQLHSADTDADEIEDSDIPTDEFKHEGLKRNSMRRRRQSSTQEAAETADVSGKDDTGNVSTENDEKDEKIKDVGIMQLLPYNVSEWPYIAIGCINCIIHGGLQPVFAILFGGVLEVFQPEYDPEEERRIILLLSCMYIVLGAGSGLSFFFSAWMFGISGESLTTRLRKLTFKALLRQEMSFFDNPKNATGALTTRLATDASAVQGATGVRLGMMLQAVATIAVGLVIGFIYSWKFALFILGVMPFIMIGAMMQMKLAKGFASKNKNQLESAGKVATEAVTNIRTVASLCKEDKFVEDYLALMEPSYRDSLKTAHVFGITFSFLQSMIFFCYAAIFYFGAWLIAYQRLDYGSMFKVFAAIIFGAISLGRESAFVPDYGKSKMAAGRILALLASEPKIDNYSTTGEKPQKCSGNVELTNVEFYYPNRPTVKVMRGVNVQVEMGQTIALVGHTGCGKSTTIQLLERLYDASAGSVTVDGIDVRELNVSWLRSQLGLVSQEPVLFDYSIRENIEYGDNSRQVTIDEVIAAARQANIHNFIASLPNGYETRVGDKGTQLSGGQKQRIAIARALVRNPKVLLLDEATSALDTESEQVVQEALDRARHGRTCIVIAHRLSTIQNADRIYVFQQGRVAEQGTHAELMNIQSGIYNKLQRTNEK